MIVSIDPSLEISFTLSFSSLQEEIKIVERRKKKGKYFLLIIIRIGFENIFKVGCGTCKFE